MIRPITKLLSVCIMFMLITSCNSEDKYEMLLAHTWLLTAEKVNGQNKPLDECEKDDTWKFDGMGNLVFDFGKMLCDSNQPKTDHFVYNIYNNNTTMSVSRMMDNKATTVKIISISDEKLVVTVSDAYGTDENTFKAL